MVFTLLRYRFNSYIQSVFAYFRYGTIVVLAYPRYGGVLYVPHLLLRWISFRAFNFTVFASLGLSLNDPYISLHISLCMTLVDISYSTSLRFGLNSFKLFSLFHLNFVHVNPPLHFFHYILHYFTTSFVSLTLPCFMAGFTSQDTCRCSSDDI